MEKLIYEYIHHWGADNYVRWCSPETDMEDFFEDDDIWAAQFKYNNKPRTNIPPGLQPLNPDPYKNKIRDKDGNLIPESFETHDIYYDVDYDFISTHGIVHYIVSTTCKVSLPNLLKSKYVADAQHTYIASHRVSLDNQIKNMRNRRFYDDSASSPVVGDGGPAVL